MPAADRAALLTRALFDRLSALDRQKVEGDLRANLHNNGPDDAVNRAADTTVRKLPYDNKWFVDQILRMYHAELNNQKIPDDFPEPEDERNFYS